MTKGVRDVSQRALDCSQVCRARRILGIRSHYAYAGSYHYLITEAFNVIGLLDAHW